MVNYGIYYQVNSDFHFAFSVTGSDVVEESSLLGRKQHVVYNLTILDINTGLKSFCRLLT
jgi:hypothetical protein